MGTKLCLFEDGRNRNFLPLSSTRPVYDLRCGLRTLAEKVIDLYPDVQVCLSTRDTLKDIVREWSPYPVNELDFSQEDSCLFVNGRLLINLDLVEKMSPLGDDRLFLHGEDIVALRLKGERLSRLGPLFSSPVTSHIVDELQQVVPTTQLVDVSMVTYPWDLIYHNSPEICRDFSRMGEGGRILGSIDPQVVIYNRPEIYVGEKSQIDAGVVLDARVGPIFVDEEVIIQPFTRIEGPAYIGRGTIIVGGKIRGGCSLGPICRVGGEVEASILHGYTNKYHDGFLGHAYVGEWVNLGALTTNSDLKNNYQSVKVTIDEHVIDTGMTKVGSFIADHVKTGIGTLLNTGTVIGVASNIFGGGLPPKSIPSFVWGGGDDFVEYDLQKGLETARLTMSRRGVKMTEAYQALWRSLFELTKEERLAFLSSV